MPRCIRHRHCLITATIQESAITTSVAVGNKLVSESCASYAARTYCTTIYDGTVRPTTLGGQTRFLVLFNACSTLLLDASSLSDRRRLIRIHLPSSDYTLYGPCSYCTIRPNPLIGCYRMHGGGNPIYSSSDGNVSPWLSPGVVPVPSSPYSGKVLTTYIPTCCFQIRSFPSTMRVQPP
ncbi:hypothetical protein BDV95DRAFT_253183 [Massariosphaeria phaeospora]|uniref:Uncharacterized protein n=1 Tax=Massariosphaeria phaeospora TaxID=100035 RepID=A0A7C8I1E9_9PLEO|nr:hypothetical protein BDV95DRAFT_253183 [Massariosphaeria phaeospora]